MILSYLGDRNDDVVELEVDLPRSTFVRDDLINPEWIEDTLRVGNGPIRSMDPAELLFFQVNRVQGSLLIPLILLHRPRPNFYLRKHPKLFN